MASFTDISLDSTFESTDIPGDVIQELEEKPPTDGFVDKIIRLYLKHNLSLVCLEDWMKLLNERGDDCDKLPTGKVQILKLFREHREIIDIILFVTCKCEKITKVDPDNKKNLKCSRCDKILKTTETNFFVIMPIQQQIVKSLKNNWYYISKFDTSNNFESKSYTDAHDGSILRTVLNLYRDSDINILSLCLNLDGANKFNSNSLSVWPIQLIQNYLPPHVRFLPKNIIVAGLFYSDRDSKLDCHNYLLPLVNELNHLKIHMITMNIEDEDYTFKPLITHCAFDLPAKSKVQETKQYGSYDGCTYCEIHGEIVVIESTKNKKGKHKKEPIMEPNKMRTKCVRYVEGNSSYKLRDEAETLKKMLAASTSNSTKVIDGIKDVSCLVGLEHFHIIWSIGVEYMHCALLGVTKRIFNFFFNSKYSGKDFYFGPRKQKALSTKILQIKPTASVVRKPRSLDQRANFKASEYRSMLLYYLPVCLPGLVPNVYVQHVRLLSAAIYTLLKDNIPKEEVDNAETKLHTFVKQHQELFGKVSMVMVIHLLKHFAESVRRLGPLWCHSAFPFERNNGYLLKFVNGTTDVLHQISSKYALAKSIPEQKHIDDKSKILLGKDEKIVETSSQVLSIGSLEILDLSNITLSVHKRIRLHKTIYTSLLYTRPKRTIDYFIGLKGGLIGIAKYYFDYNGIVYVKMTQFDVIDNIDHILKVNTTNRAVLAPTYEIEKKYLFMTVGVNHYIISPPNPYENE